MKTVYCVVSGRELEGMFTTFEQASSAIDAGDFYMPSIVEDVVSDAEFIELLGEELQFDMSNRNAAYQVDDLATGKAYLVIGSDLMSFIRELRKSGNFWGYNAEMWCSAQDRFDNMDVNPMLLLNNGVEEFA